MQQQVKHPRFTCPVKNAVAIVGDKWTLFILRELYLGKKKQGINELLSFLKPMSSRTLAKKLRNLLEQKLIEKRIISKKPPKVEYSLTKKGLSFRPVLQRIGEWYKIWGDDRLLFK